MTTPERTGDVISEQAGSDLRAAGRPPSACGLPLSCPAPLFGWVFLKRGNMAPHGNEVKLGEWYAVDGDVQERGMGALKHSLRVRPALCLLDALAIGSGPVAGMVEVMMGPGCANRFPGTSLFSGVEAVRFMELTDVTEAVERWLVWAVVEGLRRAGWATPEQLTEVQAITDDRGWRLERARKDAYLALAPNGPMWIAARALHMALGGRPVWLRASSVALCLARDIPFKAWQMEEGKGLVEWSEMEERFKTEVNAEREAKRGR